jgi:hypothetical protein
MGADLCYIAMECIPYAVDDLPKLKAVAYKHYNNRLFLGKHTNFSIIDRCGGHFTPYAWCILMSVRSDDQGVYHEQSITGN